MFTVRTDSYSAWCPHPQTQGAGPQPGSFRAASRIPGGLSRAKSDYRAMPVSHQRSFVTWERERFFLENILNLPPCRPS